MTYAAMRTGACPQADKRARPLARRRLRISRPALVLMRALKPCLRLRRRLFGWKVLLLTWTSSLLRPTLSSAHHRSRRTWGAFWMPTQYSVTPFIHVKGSSPQMFRGFRLPLLTVSSPPSLS